MFQGDGNACCGCSRFLAAFGFTGVKVVCGVLCFQSGGNGRPMTREFVGIAALGVSYDITWGDRIYQGDAAGAGITFGYALNLNRRLNVEFYGGFGAVYFKQKQYYKNDNIEDYTDGTAQANANGYKLLPIKIGVSISYIFK
jgi:hypothetical protein